MVLVSVICCMFVCVLPLSQPGSRGMDYPLSYVHVLEIKRKYKEKERNGNTLTTNLSTSKTSLKILIAYHRSYLLPN